MDFGPRSRARISFILSCGGLGVTARFPGAQRTQNIARGVVAMSDDMEWKHDMFQEDRIPASQRLGGARGGISTGTKL